MIRQLPAVLAIVGATACVTAMPTGPLTGSWGGQHVGLTITPAGGTLEYDCAVGRIDGPLIVQPDGRFKASGTHFPGIGGPERIGEIRPAYPTDYIGSVRGDRMTLTARVANGVLLGPFELRRGAEPNLLRCL